MLARKGAQRFGIIPLTTSFDRGTCAVQDFNALRRPALSYYCADGELFTGSRTVSRRPIAGLILVIDTLLQEAPK